MPFDGSQLDDVTKLLIEGRERIERDGWCQKARALPDGRVCMVGSLGFADAPRRRYAPEQRLALDRLGVAIGMTDGSLVFMWNDTPGRTKDEVLAAFDKAIAQIT